ncbi:MAG: hypothetical protein GC189_14580 [Alphaproteobacteria bacterium]|nr:hypothetical protein [Alphaproteobacteria bacterium]
MIEFNFVQTRTHILIAVVQVGSLAGCATPRAPIQAPALNGQIQMKRLIDLHTATLRDEWTDDDLHFVMKNERLLAYFDAIIENPGLEIVWSKTVGLVWQRQLNFEDDFYAASAHPRDLDLTPYAYVQLGQHIFNRMKAGEIPRDPTWRFRFPELYTFDPQSLPEVE